MAIQHSPKKTCRICRNGEFLDVHHRRYYKKGKNILFNENPGDLALLCRECHFLFHQYFDPIKKKYKMKRQQRITNLLRRGIQKEIAFITVANGRYGKYKNLLKQNKLWN